MLFIVILSNIEDVLEIKEIIMLGLDLLND